MTSFKKVAIGRDKLGRINTRVNKQSKVPNIIRVHELNLNPSTTSMISKILPQIEKIASYSFPEQVKSALIANIVDEAFSDTNEDWLTHRSSSDRFPYPKLSTPKYKTPQSKIGHIFEEEDDSLVKELSHLYNSNREVLDAEGFPIPNSNIDRVASWIRKNSPKSKRGPVGTQAIAHDFVRRGTKWSKGLGNIRNRHFLDKLINARKFLEEKEKATLKKQKRQIGGK